MHGIAAAEGHGLASRYESPRVFPTAAAEFDARPDDREHHGGGEGEGEGRDGGKQHGAADADHEAEAAAEAEVEVEVPEPETEADMEHRWAPCVAGHRSIHVIASASVRGEGWRVLKHRQYTLRMFSPLGCVPTQGVLLRPHLSLPYPWPRRHHVSLSFVPFIPLPSCCCYRDEMDADG